MSTKAEQIAKDVAAAVGAGKAVASETVDFNDPNRPKTCLEVDFPILPVNQVAAIEGNAGKPIYQMSKWWARRRSSVFRSMLIAAATKAPDDASKADKVVWDAYYGNHQKKGSFKHLKVADIFMGGGTTIVEGSRLGMQMYGNDLNPVAWFVVKNELAQVDRKAVEALLADVEREVKPQIMPFYACDCPRGHKGTWTHLPTGKVMGADFDPLSLTPEQRKDYSYGRWRTRRGELLPLNFNAENLTSKERAEVYFDAVETIYVFWAKHGPCQVTGCGHRTPVMSSPVMAIKTLTVKAWAGRRCIRCHASFDIEDASARMAPSVPLVCAPSEPAWAVYNPKDGVTCPHCGFQDRLPSLPGKPKTKKVELSLLVHPSWLAGSPRNRPDGREFGGSVTDSAESTVAWNQERAGKLRLIEVRGPLPETVTCPETGVTFSTSVGTVPKRSNFACGSCGALNDVLDAVKATGKMGPLAAYAVQGHCGACEANDVPYGGRFFVPATDSRSIDAAFREWESRRDGSLRDWWPRNPIAYGFMTHMNNGGIPNHGFTHWWTMFNHRQLLGHAILLQYIVEGGSHAWAVREYVLGAFQQFVRNQSLMSFWHIKNDTLAPALSNNNFHPKATMIELGGFAQRGYGPWAPTARALLEGLEWRAEPWELVSKEYLTSSHPGLADEIAGRSTKAFPGDRPHPAAKLTRGSATECAEHEAASMDLVITDPPFGGLLHYSELSDFFYVWLRLALRRAYPSEFGPELTPKALEIVENRARNPDDHADFYKRLLTDAWRQAARILKPGGILAFTFHHSEDEPWVAVLDSLFGAGFILEATYPIRSDTTVGEGSKPGTFGSQKIEYDIIHVCRKRLGEPVPISWARLRRQILQDARRLEEMLSHHRIAGLPDADIAVVRRGKALEHFSRHYGRVLVEGDSAMEVKDALAGINQVLDQEAGGLADPPPSSCVPKTWQFCRMFDMRLDLARDQMQKYLRGTGYSTQDYVDPGWVVEEDKTFKMVSPLAIARGWIGRWRSGLRGDYEQAMFLIGASFEGSGINVTDTLNNDSFKPHPALAGLLEWFSRRGGDAKIRAAAGRARQLYAQWQQKHSDKDRQLKMFQDEEDAR
jgi:adenine-specific DNA methylase